MGSHFERPGLAGARGAVAGLLPLVRTEAQGARQVPGNTGPLRPKPRKGGGGVQGARRGWPRAAAQPVLRGQMGPEGSTKGPSPSVRHPRRSQLQESLSPHSRFSHLHLPAALQRLGRAGRSAGEPGPASGVATSASGLGGRLPAPQAASGLACGSPPGPF